jgi:hypothetical protein
LTVQEFASSTTWLALLGGLATTNLVLGVSNLIPSWGRSGSRANDGATLLGIARGERVSIAMQAIGWLSGLSFDGVQARDWDPELIRCLETEDIASEERPMRDMMLVGHYEGSHELERAHAFLENSEAAKSGKYPALTIERAFLVALIQQNPDQAASLLETVPSRLRQSYFNYWRAQALVYALQGQEKSARSAVQRARRLAKTHGGQLDEDDISLFRAIESGNPPPFRFGQPQPA